MAGANEVGKITIRVSPDLDRFREELKAELEKAEREVKGKIKVGVEADTTGLRREIQDATKGIKADVGVGGDTSELTRDLERATRGLDAKVKLRLDESFADRALRQLDANLQKLKATGKNLDLFSTAGQGLFDKILNPPLEPKLIPGWEKDIRSELDALKELTVDVNPSKDSVNKLRDDLLKKAYELRFTVDDNYLRERLYRFIQDVKVKAPLEFDSSVSGRRAKAQLEATFLELQGLARLQKVEVPVEINVDRNRIQRGFAALGEGLSKLGSGVVDLGKTGLEGIANGLYNVGSASASAVKGFISFGQTGMLVVAVAALIAPALALVSGALVALPAAIAGFAVPIGAIAFGLDGIKKAAENAGLIKGGKVKKGESKLGQALDDIKAKVSDVFENGLTPAFTAIGDLAGKIAQPMTTVAKGLVDVFSGVTESLSSVKGTSEIQNTIDNIGKAISAAKPGIRDFTDGILELVSTLSNKFPGLADAFNRTGKSFLEWVDKITTADPSTGVSKLDTAMKTLGDTLSGLGGIVSDLFTNGFDNLSNVDFGKSMTGFVDSVKSLVNDTLPALANAFQVIASALKPIAAVVDAIDAVLNRLGSASIPKLDGSQSGLETLFGKPGKWLDDWINGGDLAKQAGDAGRQLAESLQTGMSDGLQAGTALGAGLTDTLQGIGPAVSKQIKDAITVSAEDQKAALKSAFTGDAVNSAVSQQLTDQVTAAVQGAKNAMANLGPELQAQIDQSLLPLATIADKVGLAFSTVAPAVVAGMQTAVAAVQSIGTQIGQVLSSTLGGNLYQSVFAALQGVAGAVTAGLGAAAGAAVSGAGQIVNAVLQGLTPVLDAVNTIFGAIPGIIQAQMGAAVGAIQGACGQMVSTALSFAGAMEQAGVAIGASFAKGIASQTGLVASSAAALMSAARAFFPNSPADEGPFSGSGWVDKSGEAVGQGFAKGMSQSQEDVVSTARALMQAVKDIFGSAEGLTLNFNMGPVTQQATQATAAVQSFGDTLKSFPAPVLTDTISAGADAKAQKKSLQQQLDLLEMERKQLELQKAQGGDQSAIKARLEEIKQQKLQLGLQQNQLDYAQKYGDQVDANGSKMDQAYKDLSQKAFSLPVDFGKNVASQFTQDLGISGGGALGAIADYGMQLGTQFIFNVSNIDEAMAVQKNQVAKQAMGVVGR